MKYQYPPDTSYNERDLLSPHFKFLFQKGDIITFTSADDNKKHKLMVESVYYMFYGRRKDGIVWLREPNTSNFSLSVEGRKVFQNGKRISKYRSWFNLDNIRNLKIQQKG